MLNKTLGWWATESAWAHGTKYRASTKSLVCTLVIVHGNVWIYHRVPSAVPVSPWLEAVWQWASFLSSSTVTGRCSLQQINQVPGAGNWPGLPWRHLAQLRQLDTNGESSHHLVAKITISKMNSYLKIVRLMLNISSRSPVCGRRLRLGHVTIWQPRAKTKYISVQDRVILHS